MPKVREIARGLRFLEGPGALCETSICFGRACPLNGLNV
jgi:hypothetical protein